MRERRTPPIVGGRLRVAHMCVAWVLAVAACSVLAAPVQPGVQAGRSRASVMMPVLLGGCAFVLGAGGPRAEASMLRIKKEAAGRRRARAQETLRPGAFNCFECTARGDALLLPKPVHPRDQASASSGLRATTPSLEDSPHAELQLGINQQASCSCQDVHDLQRKLARAQDDHRALARRVLRVEGMLVDLVQTLQTSDDIALLERRTCSAVVYNEELTRSRPLRLLREDLKKLQEKYAL